jgi:hypothetical protein
MVRRSALWMAALLAMLATVSAWAAEDVFHAIPSDALAFAAANRIAETSGKVRAVARQVGAPPVGLLEMAKAVTGANKGIDDTRAAGFVVMANKDPKGEPAPVFLIPVSNYKEFLEAWDAKPDEKEKIVELSIAGQPMLVAQRGDYAAISPKERNFREGLEKLLAAKQSVADEYPQILPWLTENDVVAVATSRGVKLASEALRQQLQQMEEMFSRMNVDQNGPSPIMILQVYAKVLQWAEKEIDTVGVAVRVDKQGAVHLSKRARFVKDSQFAASMAKLQPLEKGPLAGIPAGPFMLAGGGPWSDSVGQGMLAFQSDLMKKSFRMSYGLDEKQAEELAKKALDTPKGIHSLSMLMGTGQPGEPVLGSFLALYNVDDAAKYLDEYQKYIAAMNDSAKATDAASAKKLFTVKKTEVAGRPAVENEMAIPLPPNTAGVPNVEEKMGKLLGPGGKFKTVLVAIDDHTVALTFTGRAPLIARAIAAAKNSSDNLTADPEIVKTAALLPAGAQWVAYFNPNGAVAFAKWIVDAMTDEGGAKPNIPDFPAVPPIGIAAKAIPGELQVETVVPSAVLDAIGKYVGLVRSAEHPEVP